jgi:hypothetical protein
MVCNSASNSLSGIRTVKEYNYGSELTKKKSQVIPEDPKGDRDRIVEVNASKGRNQTEINGFLFVQHESTANAVAGVQMFRPNPAGKT